MINFKYPSKEECIEMFKEFGTPDNIQLHCKKVAEICKFLGEKLNEKGGDVDIDFLEVLGLLHDMFKHVFLDYENLQPNDFYKNKGMTSDQEKIWMKLKYKHGNKQELYVLIEEIKDRYPEFSKYILKNADKYGEDGEDLEYAIVEYIDRRVMVDEIKSLEERNKYVREKYKDYFIKKGIDVDKLEKKFFNIEKKIFEKLDFGPEELKNVI